MRRVERVRPAGEVNCGTCEKCLRTRLALAAVGALARAPTFPPGAPTVAEVRRMPLSAGFSVTFVDELAAPLAAAGRMGCIAAAEVIGHFGARPEADVKALFRREGLI